MSTQTNFSVDTYTLSDLKSVNTCFVYACRSDNGGCYKGGGPAAPLRGTKYTLLEGGTKVDAFIYSWKFDKSMSGTFFDGLFHVTDWVPTILEFAGITYDAKKGYELDGVSQVSGFATGDSIREKMLYNYYTNAEHSSLDMWTNAPVAIRKDQ